jgi:hypothetical protein
METIANSSEDVLIDSLSYKLGNSASYITDRKSSTFWPSGSNIYKPSSGTKVIKFQLNSEGWLDSSTVVVNFDLHNNDTNTPPNVEKYVRPLQGGHSFFRRLRISAGGSLIEDIDMYNRTHQMFEMLTSKSNRDNSDIEGFGYRSDTTEPDTTHGNWSLPGVGQGSHQTVGFKLCSGLLNQSKMLPLKYMGNLTIELELVNHKDDPVVSNYDTVLTEAVCSSEWSIENVQLKCDIVNIDNTLQNNYDSHLLNGGKLPISYNTYICQSQAVSGTDLSVNVSRAISRLKSVFVSFYKSEYKDAAGAVVVNPMTKAIRKEWLDFVHPMENAGDAAGLHLVYDKGYELEFQMQIGSKLFPEYPIRSVSEAFSQLKKSVGILGSNFHSVSISPTQYRNDHFVIGIDTEKALGASYTGVNTRAGDLLSVRVKAQDTAVLTAAKMPDQMFIVLHSDCMLEISDSGVSVFD